MSSWRRQLWRCRSQPQAGRGARSKGALSAAEDAAGIEAFQRWGTPVAYLLDEKGRVAKPLAVGADQVSVLARYAVGKATEAELGAGASGKQGTWGQGAGKQPETQEIEGAGPGTELKKLLGKMGIAVTPDCRRGEVSRQAGDRQGAAE